MSAVVLYILNRAGIRVRLGLLIGLGLGFINIKYIKYIVICTYLIGA